MKSKISIGISTRNRPKSFCELSYSILQYTPSNFEIFVVDDASDTDYSYPDFRFDTSAGISRVKNKCLQLCYESGAGHIFLFDDDVRILKDDWWKPYVESGEHHFCATFLPSQGTFISKKLIDVKTNIEAAGSMELKTKAFESFPEFKFKEALLKRHLLGNGYCLYFTRKCIKTVGGFDIRFNNKYEHCDLSRRIHAAGLTRYKYQDVANSAELIYCLDQDKAIERSFSEKEMQANLKSGYDLYRQKERENTSEYIEFRT